MLKWHGEEFKKYFRKHEGQRIEAACIYLKNKIKENISEPSPPPSTPGNYPHKDTGSLRASIAHEVDKEKMVGRVGTNNEVGKFLELGTSKMAPRPFLHPTLNHEMKNIQQIIGGKKLE